MRNPPAPRLPSRITGAIAPEVIETPAGVRVGELIVAPNAERTVEVADCVLCLICLDGVATLDERHGTLLARPGFIAVRHSPYSGTLRAGPEAVRLVMFEWPPHAVATLGPAAEAFSTQRTLFGRGSIELAWRAAGELRLGDPLMPHAVGVMAHGIAIAMTRGVWYGSRSLGTVSPRAMRARRLLDRRIGEPLDLGALARETGSAPAYLSRLFPRSFGMSPMEYVMRRRVEKARLLLSRTRRSVAEIATALGFHDSSHFARQFRRHTGTSPAEFRSRQEGNGQAPAGEVNNVPE